MAHSNRKRTGSRRCEADRCAMAAGISQQAIADGLEGGQQGHGVPVGAGKSRPTDQQIRAMAKLLKTRNFIVNGG